MNMLLLKTERICPGSEETSNIACLLFIPPSTTLKAEERSKKDLTSFKSRDHGQYYSSCQKLLRYLYYGNKSELFIERGRRSRLEGEAAAARDAAAALRAELRRQRGAEGGHDAAQVGASEAESTISRLKNQIKKLKEELAASQAEARALRGGQARAARDLRQASAVAETSLRELLSGLEQLKSLSSALDPP